VIQTSKGKVSIEKGQRIFVPLISIQQDPDYYHDPQDFLPERFDPEHGGTKSFVDRGVLAPFGNGPRECLGKRFAQLQLKAAVYEIVRNFEISIDTNLTAKVLEIDPGELLMNVKKGGMWLKFKPVQ
jgi:cytochrome P450